MFATDPKTKKVSPAVEFNVTIKCTRSLVLKSNTIPLIDESTVYAMNPVNKVSASFTTPV